MHRFKTDIFMSPVFPCYPFLLLVPMKWRFHLSKSHHGVCFLPVYRCFAFPTFSFVVQCDLIMFLLQLQGQESNPSTTQNIHYYVRNIPIVNNKPLERAVKARGGGGGGILKNLKSEKGNVILTVGGINHFYHSFTCTYTCQYMLSYTVFKFLP